MATKSSPRQWRKPSSISTKRELEMAAELKTGLQWFSLATQNYRGLCELLPPTQRPPPLARLRDAKDIRCIAERTAWLECRVAQLKRTISQQHKVCPIDVNFRRDPAMIKRIQRAKLIFHYTSLPSRYVDYTLTSRDVVLITHLHNEYPELGVRLSEVVHLCRCHHLELHYLDAIPATWLVELGVEPQLLEIIQTAVRVLRTQK